MTFCLSASVTGTFFHSCAAPRVHEPSAARQSTECERARATHIRPSAITPNASVGPNTFATSCDCSPNVASPKSGPLMYATVSATPVASVMRRMGRLSRRTVAPGAEPPSTLVRSAL